MNIKLTKKQTVGVLLDRDFDDADDGIEEILQQFNDIANEDSVFEFITDIPTLEEEQHND